MSCEMRRTVILYYPLLKDRVFALDAFDKPQVLANVDWADADNDVAAATADVEAAKTQGADWRPRGLARL